MDITHHFGKTVFNEVTRVVAVFLYSGIYVQRRICDIVVFLKECPPSSNTVTGCWCGAHASSTLYGNIHVDPLLSSKRTVIPQQQILFGTKAVVSARTLVIQGVQRVATYIQ